METMELNHLRYFYEVARSGSFTEAARRLHISQSALSKAVGLLEAAEGVKLFTRGKKGVTLTTLGNEVFERSRAIFDAVIEIQDACRGTKAVCEGHLRFGASDHVINYYLIASLMKMVKAHPMVVPSIVTGGPNEICAAVLNSQAEFGVFFTKINMPQLVYESLRSIEMAIVHRPAVRPRSKKPSIANLRKFLNENGFISSVGSEFQHHPSASLIGQLGGFPPVIFECNNQDGQKQFCMKVGGVAYLARAIVEKELKEGSLVEYLLPKKFYLDLLLVRRRAQVLSLNSQTYLNLLRFAD